jgi:5-methyltetrahydrofolate--homocysteine methyltransferase
MDNTFLNLLRERVIVYDGAMGTSIQQKNLSVADYWDKEGCSEILMLSQPRGRERSSCSCWRLKASCFHAWK